MPELTSTEIETISRDIRREEITFSHLPDDIIDHVCCAVEDEMQKGLGFDEAYRKVRENISPRRIREIQEEILYAVDKNYRIMKNIMKISAVTGTLLLGLAATFKIQHWPPAGVMAVIGAFITAFVFMPSALNVLWKETHSGKRIFLFVSAFLTGFLFITGALFKIQHWPFAGMLLTLATACGVFCFVPALLFSKLSGEMDQSKKLIYILGTAGIIFYFLGLLFKLQHWPTATLLMALGLIILALIVFPLYTFKNWKEEQTTNVKFIYMVIGLIAIVVPAALVTMNLQRSFEKPYFEHQSEQQALYKYLYGKNQQFLKENTRPELQSTLSQINSKTADLLKFVNGIESAMISVSEGSAGNPAVITSQIKQTDAGPEIQYTVLKQTFSRGPAEAFLFPGSQKRKELDARLKDFSFHLGTMCSPDNVKRFDYLLDPSVCLPGDDPDNKRITLMAGLHSLGLLKNSILVTESGAFCAVSQK